MATWASKTELRCCQYISGQLPLVKSFTQDALIVQSLKTRHCRKICSRENRQADNRKGHLPLLQEELRRSCRPRMEIVKADGRTIMLNQTKPTLHIPIKPTERQSDGQPQTDGPTDRQTDRHANKMLPGTARATSPTKRATGDATLT